jgi:hypothetical protein
MAYFMQPRIRAFDNVYRVRLQERLRAIGPDQDPDDPGYNSSNCDEECPIELGVPHILPEDKKGLDRLGPRLGFLDSH